MPGEPPAHGVELLPVSQDLEKLPGGFSESLTSVPWFVASNLLRSNSATDCLPRVNIGVGDVVRQNRPRK